MYVWQVSDAPHSVVCMLCGLHKYASSFFFFFFILSAWSCSYVFDHANIFLCFVSPPPLFPSSPSEVRHQPKLKLTT